MNLIPIFVAVTVLCIGYYMLNKRAEKMSCAAYLNGRRDAYMDAIVEAGACMSLGQLQRVMNNKMNTEKERLIDLGVSDECSHLMKAETEDGDIKCLGCGKFIKRSR